MDVKCTTQFQDESDLEQRFSCCSFFGEWHIAFDNTTNTVDEQKKPEPIKEIVNWNGFWNFLGWAAKPHSSQN